MSNSSATYRKFDASAINCSRNLANSVCITGRATPTLCSCALAGPMQSSFKPCAIAEFWFATATLIPVVKAASASPWDRTDIWRLSSLLCGTCSSSLDCQLVCQQERGREESQSAPQDRGNRNSNCSHHRGTWKVRSFHRDPFSRSHAGTVHTPWCLRLETL